MEIWAKKRSSTNVSIDAEQLGCFTFGSPVKVTFEGRRTVLNEWYPVKRLFFKVTKGHGYTSSLTRIMLNSHRRKTFSLLRIHIVLEKEQLS